MEFFLPALLSLLGLPMPWEFHLVQLSCLAAGILAVKTRGRYFPAWNAASERQTRKTRLLLGGATIIPLVSGPLMMLFFKSLLAGMPVFFHALSGCVEFVLYCVFLVHSKGLFFYLRFFPGQESSSKADSTRAGLTGIFPTILSVVHYLDLQRLYPSQFETVPGRHIHLAAFRTQWVKASAANLARLGRISCEDEIPSGRKTNPVLSSLATLGPFLVLPLLGLGLLFL